MNIKLVARRAKVSIATVSRTINNNPAVAHETADKVWRAIRELKYHPNTYARTLVSGKSRILGLIISDISNPFFPELVKGFEENAIRAGYEVMVANTEYDPNRMTNCVHRMFERKVDGVAIMTSEMDEALLQELSTRGVPVVLLDLGRGRPRMFDLSVDYSSGIDEAVLHLAQLGHKRIGFISGPLSLKSARVRRSSFIASLKQRGIPVHQDLILEANHKVDGGESVLRALLAVENRPTAVMCSNDLSAIGALRGIHEAGLRVPEDISLIGFDDIELSQYLNPPLTTVRLSRDELGREAFHALQNSIEEKDEVVRRRISTRLIVRGSTAPPAAARRIAAKRSTA